MSIYFLKSIEYIWTQKNKLESCVHHNKETSPGAVVWLINITASLPE